MGRRRLDLTPGQRFGRLVVRERVGNNKYGTARWLVRCDCGEEKVASQNNLKNGSTKSCGSGQCWPNKGSLKHGHSGGSGRKKASPSYCSWKSMLQRCLNPNVPSYLRYGGAGVTVCDRWINSFENFLADMGERLPDTTLGRFGDVGPYEKSNCSWQTSADQVANRRLDRKYCNQWTAKKAVEQTEIAA